MILLPVLALGAVGLWQLQKDRAAALAEAREEAEAVLAEVLELAEVIADPEGLGGTISNDALLVWPESMPSVPVPSESEQVPPSALQLMEIMDAEDMPAEEKTEALVELVKLNEANPSFDSAKTNAGLSVKKLALRNALRFGSEAKISASRLHELAIRLVEAAIAQPSMFTDRFIADATTYIANPKTDERWQSLIEKWDNQQVARTFFRENQPEVDRLSARLPQLEPGVEKTSTAAWIESGQWFYCKMTRSTSRIKVHAIPAEALTGLAHAVLKKLNLPEHLGLRLTLDGRTILGEPGSRCARDG